MSDTVFVAMYDPALGKVQVQAPLEAVPTYQSHGWLLVDPSATPPPVATPYLTQAAGDSRYLRAWQGAETLTAGAVRYAPDGHVIVRNANGTTRSSYDATEAAAWTVVGGSAVASPDSAPVALVSGFGDSQMAHGIPHLAFAAALSGRFAVADIVSHPGYTSTALLPLITDITQSSKKPAACLLACGANDAISKTPLATFTANITAMIAALKVAGISVILATIPPLDDDTERPFQQQYNVWIERYGRANRIPVVPFATTLSDVNGKWNAAYAAGDGVHQSDVGNKAMGQAFANAVSFLPTDGILPAYQGGQNLVTNGLLTGDANLDLIPDTWGIGSTTGLTLSLGTATGVRGNLWSVTVTDGGSHTFQGGGIDAGANTFAPGDRIRVAARISSAQNTGSSNLQLTCFVTPAYTVTQNTPVLTPFGTGALDVQLTGGVVMQEFVVPANTNLMIFQWAVSGNGTYDIAQLGVWNLTKLGVA